MADLRLWSLPKGARDSFACEDHGTLSLWSLVSFRIALSSAAFSCLALAGASLHADRRVVDTVDAGNAVSEANHGYVGADDAIGLSGGKSYRQARGWMRYAMTTFDDTEVTVACTFLMTDSASHSYDLVVEDSVIATRTFATHAPASTVVEIAVPYVLTKGKTNIAVIFRARGGSTPALQQLRTVQNHNELE
ncbi:MAG: DUF6805 domain-containing protein [Gemmatimonadaceae bacterium]